MVFSASTLQSSALRRQPLLQLRPKQNFILAARLKSGAAALLGGVRLDRQASGLW